LGPPFAFLALFPGLDPDLLAGPPYREVVLLRRRRQRPDREVVEFFLEREAAAAMIEEVWEDEPVLAEELRGRGDRARPGLEEPFDREETFRRSPLSPLRSRTRSKPCFGPVTASKVRRLSKGQIPVSRK
jgi:hypothetical protein